MIDYKKILVELLKMHFPEDVDLESLIEVPPNPDMGDFAIPMFQLSKQMKKSPVAIAAELAVTIEPKPYFTKVEAMGPYLNFFVYMPIMAKELINSIVENPEGFGSSKLGNGKKVLVEFSSPNIAKPFHIGHIRSTVIGHALYNIYKTLGYETVSINHLGDYGTQFGMLITAYKKWGDKKVVEADPIRELLKLYVRINEEAENNDEVKEESRRWFKALEEGNSEAVELWQWFREVSLDEFSKVYNMLGIEFDSYAGESFYSDKMPAVIDELEAKGLLEESDGAYVVDIKEKNIPPVMIIKSDGSTIYTTRDIAAAFYRKNHYDFYKNIYVVGSQQSLHFNSWFKVVELMGYPWAKDCIHVPFGMVSLEDGTLSTRRGKVLFLEDVLNQAVDNAYEIIKERGSHIEDEEGLARQVGIGAVIFQELFNQRIKDYVFSWDRALSFDGETGPYVQYTHARIGSLLSKGEFKQGEFDENLLDGEAERMLLQAIYRFPQVIIDSHIKYEPFFITRHIVEIAKLFNAFYNQTPINVEDYQLKNARQHLAYATKVAISNGLKILGIEAPERM
ncbi:MAG: arginine--tRNA ligase [Tissierellia bacterium]|nr:arginine--tRNA ligase [Tissierellia bacterium]